MKHREIKFRVWVPEEKRFRYADYVPTMGFVWGIDGTKLEVGENYPQQCTGIKDEKGREIFEGDVLNCVHRTHNKYVDVGFDVYSAEFTIDGRSLIDFLKWNVVEVVGNIYETPELIGKSL